MEAFNLIATFSSATYYLNSNFFVTEQNFHLNE